MKDLEGTRMHPRHERMPKVVLDFELMMTSLWIFLKVSRPESLVRASFPHLLQVLATKESSDARPNRRRKPGQDAARFKIDDDSGKMIIEDGAGFDTDTSDAQKKAGMDVAGTAYRESLTSIDGFTRGPNGRVKFNKDTKKRRREGEDVEEDVEMADGEVKGKNNKRRTDIKLGHEFKAKRAGGDVKKGGIDPYAYLTLSQAAKKGGRGGRSNIGIAGKKR